MDGMMGVVLATSPSALLRGSAKLSCPGCTGAAALVALNEFLLFFHGRFQRINLLLLLGQLRLQSGDIV